MSGKHYLSSSYHAWARHTLRQHNYDLYLAHQASLVHTPAPPKPLDWSLERIQDTSGHREWFVIPPSDVSRVLSYLGRLPETQVGHCFPLVGSPFYVKVYSTKPIESGRYLDQYRRTYSLASLRARTYQSYWWCFRHLKRYDTSFDDFGRMRPNCYSEHTPSSSP